MSQQTREVDPLRFTGRTIGRMLSEAIDAGDPVSEIPWAPFERPLAQAKVALLTTSGVSLKGEPPFDTEREQERPTWGDPSFRSLPADTTAERVEVNHLHIDTQYAKRDLNVALPVDRLRELVDAGEVGAIADTHYSTMGFQGNDPMRVVRTSADDIAKSLQAEGVDLLLLAPV